MQRHFLQWKFSLFKSLLILMLFLGKLSYGHIVYVTPFGADTGQGTILTPLNLVSVFNNKFHGKPGDTVYLRTGEYIGLFNCALSGTFEKPIVVTSYPGEWAVIKGKIFAAPGADYVHFINFEINGNITEKTLRVSNGKTYPPNDIPCNGGITVGNYLNHGMKIINILVKNVPGDAIELWSKAINAEVYGCIVYNNGWDAPDRGHGHGLYTQNDTGIKYILDNIFLWNMGPFGIKVYTVKQTTNNYYIDGNVHFNKSGLMVSSSKPSKNISIVDNYFGEGGYGWFGFDIPVINHNLILTGNYLEHTTVAKWDSLLCKNNKFFNEFYVIPPYDSVEPNYHINNNLFYTDVKLKYSKTYVSVDSFQLHGFEKDGSFNLPYPVEPEIIIRRNKYEEGRANIIVYNWKKINVVSLDISGILKNGDAYEIKDVQNYSGKPIAKGIYDGKKIQLPMNLTEVENIMGDFTGINHPKLVQHEHTSAAFGVFVLRKI